MNSNYPDPQQLREYVQEPIPFDDILTKDLVLTDSEELVATVENVTYRYHPTYIKVDSKTGEWFHVDEAPVNTSHTEGWEQALDLEIREDFICSSFFIVDENGETRQAEAFWILDTITIENPMLRN